MTYTLVLTLYWAFFFLALLSLFLPFNLMWRIASLSAGAFLAAHLLEQPVHWEDQSVSHSFGLVMVLMFISIVLVVLTVRLLIVVAKGPLTQEVLGTGKHGDRLGWMDLINTVLWGTNAGILLVFGLAHVLGGFPGGYALDLSVAIAAMAAAVLAAFRVIRRSKLIAAATFSAGATVATFALVGSGQADRIVERAESFAAGRPWCLVTPTTETQELALARLGFFSLPKGGARAHLVVLVRDGDALLEAHWSIRQQQFFEGAYGPVPTCDPRKDYAAAITEGRLASSAQLP